MTHLKIKKKTARVILFYFLFEECTELVGSGFHTVVMFVIVDLQKYFVCTV